MSISLVHRTFAVAAIAALFATLGLVAGSGAANADPYPPTADCAISTSSAAIASRSVTVTGSGFAGNVAVHLSIAGSSLGTVHSDASGSFTASVNVPASVEGNGQIVASAASGKCASGGSAAGGDAVHTDSSGAAGTASTGFPTAAALAVGLALIGGGAMIALIGRRRRAS